MNLNTQVSNIPEGFEKVQNNKRITLKDSTLREGLDVPKVNLSPTQKMRITQLLIQVKIPEIEVVSPGKIFEDLKFVKSLKEENVSIKISGLIYAHSPNYQEEIKQASQYLNRLDLLMPVSLKRKPYDHKTKIYQLLEVLTFSLNHLAEIGVGFPHSTQTELNFLLEIATESVRYGAKRITLYDTNGSSDPFEIYHLVRYLKQHIDIPLFFHGHNDLGLATANSLAAIYAGAEGLDVTTNGLGDRAGNASLEQVAINLHLKGFMTGIILNDLKSLSKCVEEESGLHIFKLTPVVGDYVFVHKSPAHLECPELFEAYDPKWVGFERELIHK